MKLSYIKWNLWLNAFLILSWLMEGSALARGETFGVEGFHPTFHLDLVFGFSTYKSEVVAQNDTSTHTSYTLGGNAGKEREFGFYVKTDSNTTPFEINSSEITTIWQDAVMRYRFTYVYLGVVFSKLDYLVNDQGTESVDASGSGIGGTLGMLIPFGRTGVFYLDIVSVTPATPRNALDQEVTFGARQDVDIGAAIDITSKAFDFLLGYRQRTFAVNAANSGTETITTTYMGFRYASFF